MLHYDALLSRGREQRGGPDHRLLRYGTHKLGMGNHKLGAGNHKLNAPINGLPQDGGGGVAGNTRGI